MVRADEEGERAGAAGRRVDRTWARVASSPDAVAAYDEGDALIADMRESHEEWTDLFERSLEDGGGDGSQDTDHLPEYGEVVGEWIAAQEEQAALSRECVEGQPEPVAADCLSDMVAEHGHRWNALGAELNRLGGGATLGG